MRSWCGQFRRGDMAQKLIYRDLHDIDKWGWPDPHEQHQTSKCHQHPEFTRIDITQLGDMIVGDISKNDTLDHPQGIRGTENECGRSKQTDPEVIVDGTENHHELANESACGRQATVGHGEQHEKRRELRHAIDHAAIVGDLSGVHAIVEHPDAQEHGSRDESVRNHLNDAALNPEAVEHEEAKGDKTHMCDGRIGDELLHVRLNQGHQTDVHHRNQRQTDHQGVEFTRELDTLMISLSLIAVVYIGLVALVQADMKKLVAYSSIAHMGFVTLGFFMFNSLGVQGGIVQMISHGFISGAMFLCIGVLYDRMHSRQIADYGGVVNRMPKFAALFVLFAMANSGLPATSGFVGEFMVILGAVDYNFWIGLLAATTLIFGAAYSLWMVKRVVFGDVANDHVAELRDVNAREFWMLMALAGLVLLMGIWPAPFVDVMQVSVDELLRHVATPKLPAP